jgi:hypothetical protein
MIETVKYPPHELARALPPLSDDELLEMQNDIKDHGLQFPIVLFEGKVLDGVHRQKACARANVKPRYVEFEELDFDGSPAQFVDSMNLKRRHLKLTTSQRAALGAELVQVYEKAAKERQLAALKKGSESPSPQICGNGEPGSAAEQAAKQVGVSTRSVETAVKVKKRDRRKFKDVKKGKVSVSKAASELPAKGKGKGKGKKRKPEKTLNAKVWDAYKMLLRAFVEHREHPKVKEYLLALLKLPDFESATVVCLKYRQLMRKFPDSEQEAKEHLREFLKGKEPTEDGDE